METTPVWTLARMAQCADPDSTLSPGGLFLARVEEDYRDAVSEGWYSDDVAHEIADNAVPVYTADRWHVFTDLGAWDEDVADLGATCDDLTQAAAIALYMIAERLVLALREQDESLD